MLEAVTRMVVSTLAFCVVRVFAVDVLLCQVCRLTSEFYEES